MFAVPPPPFAHVLFLPTPSVGFGVFSFLFASVFMFGVGARRIPLYRPLRPFCLGLNGGWVERFQSSIVFYTPLSGELYMCIVLLMFSKTSAISARVFCFFFEELPRNFSWYTFHNVANLGCRLLQP